MFQVKKVLGGTLNLRDYNAQIGEAYVIIRVINKLIELGMPKIKVIV